jgi:uncharacterized protein (DUF433 family)
MDWRQYIRSDPHMLQGKPVVKSTRLSVEFILGPLVSGWNEEQILRNYPALTPDSLRAVYAFTQECTQDVTLHELPVA